MSEAAGMLRGTITLHPQKEHLPNGPQSLRKGQKPRPAKKMDNSAQHGSKMSSFPENLTRLWSLPLHAEACQKIDIAEVDNQAWKMFG